MLLKINTNSSKSVKGMIEREESTSGLGVAQPIRLPLNSKRLTVGHLRRLMSALEVLTGASADEIRLMIDGKLSEAGRDVPNVQIIFPTSKPGCEFSLEDEEGKFFTVPAIEPEEHSNHISLDVQKPLGEELGEELERIRFENKTLQLQLSELEQKLEEEKTRFRELWRTNCRCLTEYDTMLSAKDSEIADLKRQLPGHLTLPDHSTTSLEASTGESATRSDELPRSRTRREKAPPVNPCTGEDLDIRLDNWLPSLGRARAWNDWTEEELILQLAGHL